MKFPVLVLFFSVGLNMPLSANQAKADSFAKVEISAKDTPGANPAISLRETPNRTSTEQDTLSASEKPAENAEGRPSYMLYLLVGVLVIGGGIMWMESRKSER